MQTEPAATPTLWQSIREALRGSHQDYTAGSLNRSILLLAIPMVLEMVLESLFAVVDVFWVSRLGADAIATVGLTESVLTLVFAVGMGLGMSTTAMVARRIGEKDPDGAAVSAVQAVFLGLIASLVLGLPFFLLAFGADGRIAGDHCQRRELHPHRSWRLGRRAAALSQQRHLPRRR
jgi:Na+-driven multidrug efflux pump